MRYETIERALELGLALPVTQSVPGWAADLAVMRAAHRLNEAVGEPTIRQVIHDLQATGLAPDDPWIYAQMLPETIAGERFMLGRFVKPSDIGGVMPIWFRVPFDWNPRHERYRLDILGRRLYSGDEEQACPRDVVWTWFLDGKGKEI